MYPSIDKIKAILLKENYISEADSQSAEAVAHNSADYIDQLIRSELLSKPLLGQAIAEAYGVPYVDLEVNPISQEQRDVVPEAVAITSRVVFIKASEQVAVLASDAPSDVDMSQLEPLFKGKKIGVAYALPEHIEAALRQYAKPLETRFSQIIETGKRVAPEIVDEIIKDAVQFRASDIHFEPEIDEVVIRFRVDGSLRDAGKIPKQHYENVLNRIKVESGMRIDEHNTAQDGAIQRRTEQINIDLRVSLIPTVEGEKVVMRVLSAYVQGISLSDIGLDAAQQELVERYSHKPFGMILTVGPTGSGKTTSLYAMLRLLNRPDINITTIEDPVEYKMPRVNQIQVREASGLTFARGLRSIVRQDPDVILVGEIRDRETAEISVNAALTGHLLFSTFHANDAATAIPRLIDMGIEPFLLASTLELVIAQRLVRKLCGHCRYSLPADEALNGVTNKAAMQYFSASDTLYAGKGCGVCNGTGFHGRSALFECIEVTPEMEDLILGSPSSREIMNLAHQQGSLPMFEDGVAKAKAGITTVAEVLRVVEPPAVSAVLPEQPASTSPAAKLTIKTVPKTPAKTAAKTIARKKR